MDSGVETVCRVSRKVLVVWMAQAGRTDAEAHSSSAPIRQMLGKRDKKGGCDKRIRIETDYGQQSCLVVGTQSSQKPRGHLRIC